MRLARFGVRTLMLIVGLVALSIWGATLGARMFDSYRYAREYGELARRWREMAARKTRSVADPVESAEYYQALERKRRREMWRPWVPAAPDPPHPSWLRMKPEDRERLLRQAQGQL